MNNMLLQACLIAQPHTKEVYFVGGCVRDMLLGKAPHDYDIVVDGDLDLIANDLSDNGWKVNDVGKNFLVLIASKFDQNSNTTFIIEIAMFRKDGTYTDGRRPDYVNVGTIYDDAERRDFTINALCMNSDGTIIDLLDGTSDLKNRIIRVIGDTKQKLTEDPLRILRAIRFSIILDFDLDKEIKDFIANNKSIIKTLSYTRKKEELEKRKEEIWTKSLRLFFFSILVEQKESDVSQLSLLQ